MATNSPWDSAEFMQCQYNWFLGLPPETLRQRLTGCGLLDAAQVAALVTAQRSSGDADHNHKVWCHLRAGERASYVKFLDVVHSMGPSYDRRYQQLKDILPSAREGQTTPQPKTVEKCVNDVEEHLQGLCRNLSETMDNLGLSTLDDDIRSCSIPLQAVKEQDAAPILALEQHLDQQRVMDRRAHKLPGRGVKRPRVAEHAGEGKTFCLEDARQLLMREPSVVTTKCAHADDGGRSSSDAAATAKPCKLEKSCMLIGSAGQGKTTVCKRVLAEVVDADKGDLALFKFVFYVPCREVERMISPDWSVLLGLDDVSAALDLTDQEKTDVLKHLSRHSDKVLIILDGIDEAGSEGFCKQSAALAAMEKRGRNNRLPNATVIATSRPCQKADTLLATCCARYRLRGFSDDQLREYCYRQLGDEIGEKCMKQLSETSNSMLKEAARSTPLMSALLCDHYKRAYATPGPSMPSSISVFYTKFMCSAVAKLEMRLGREFGHVKLARDFSSHSCGGRAFRCGELVGITTVLDYQLEEVTEEDKCPEAMELVRAFRELFRLCAACINQGDVWLPSNSLPPSAMSMCENLGLLAGRHSRACGNSHKLRFSLVHLTLQEWCASRAIASADSVLPAIAECVRHIGASEDTWVFWQFLFGALKEDTICAAMKTIDSLESNPSARQKRRMLLFLLKCLYENQQSLHENTFSVECDYDVARLPIARRYALAAQFLVKDGIRMENVRLKIVDTMAICNILQLVECTTELDVSNCGLTLDQITMLLPVLSKAKKVNMSFTKLSGVPLERIATELSKSQTPHLHLLILSMCDLGCNDEDGANLARCVQLESLMTLPVMNPSLGNEGLSSFADNLLPCHHLTYLSFGFCNLRSGCGHNLATVVTKLPALQSFRLESNSLVNRDIALVLGALKSHCDIRDLNLKANQLDDSLTSDLIDFLRARRTFEREKLARQPDQIMHLPKCRIFLSDGSISSDALHNIARSGHCGGDVIDTGSHRVTGLSTHRKTIPEMFERHRNGNLDGKLHDSMMPELGEHLAGSTDIPQLLIRDNHITDAGAMALSSSGLAENSSLRYMGLSGNQFHITGAVAVLEALASQRPVIRALDLGSNRLFLNLRSDDAECGLLRMMELLTQCQHLRVIDLCDTDMSDEVGASIVQCLKHHRSIEWIEMAQNEAGDGTVGALIQMKEVNRSLRNVSLVESRVTDAGVHDLLASVHVMAMEGVYLLSNPGIHSPGEFRPPLLNARLMLTTDTVLELIADDHIN